MSLISIRTRLKRRRTRLAIAMAVLALGSAVVAHHAMPMPDMHDMSAGAVCLAIIGAAAVVVAVALVLRPLRLRPARWRVPRGVLTVLAPRAAPARAGPLFLRLAVIRR